MNKMMIIVSVIISVFLFDLGISFNSQATVLKEQRKRLSWQNEVMSQEVNQKERFIKQPPVAMSKAFNVLINHMRMLENYGGTKMDLLFTTKGEKDNLEDHFTNSIFRNVKALPVILKINKFSKETDMGSALNDIYFLERETDLKVAEITNESDVLEVKGELYGI